VRRADEQRRDPPLFGGEGQSVARRSIPSNGSVGRVERSETRHLQIPAIDGFRKRSTHPTGDADMVQAVEKALVKAGIEFLEAVQKGEGVRLRSPKS